MVLAWSAPKHSLSVMRQIPLVLHPVFVNTVVVRGSAHPCAAAYSRAVGKRIGSTGRVTSQPGQASQIARGIALCAVR